MSLTKFSAKLKYASDMAEYELTYAQDPKNPDANTVLLDLIEHLVWMAVIAGKGDEVKQVFERGHADGVARKTELDSSKEG